MKIIRYILAFLLFAGLCFAQESRIPQAPDAKDETLQYFFKGSWLPSLDPAEIGPENYSELKNLRYGPDEIGLEGVQGYDNINTTVLSTYLKIRNAYQLKTDKTTASYVIAQAEKTAEDGSRLIVNTTAIPDQGDISTSVEFNTSGNAYRDDSSGAGVGRFSGAPNGNMTYCNGVECVAWAGEEMRVGRFLTVTTATEVLDEVDFASHVEWDVTGQFGDAAGGVTPLVFAGGAIGGTLQQVNADLASAPSSSVEYFFSYTVAVTTAPDGDFTLVLTGGDTYIPAASVSLPYTAGRHTVSFITDDSAATGNFTITAAETTASEGSITFDNVTLQKTVQNPFDVTEAVNNDLATTGNTVTIDDGGRGSWIVMASRPIQGVYYDISSANGTASYITAEYWKSDATWAAVTSPVDGTLESSKALGQDGWFMFAYTSDASPYHFQGNYLYAYKFHLSAGSAIIKYVSVNAPAQTVVDLWDGVPRQPIAFKVWRNGVTKFEDWTLEVNEYSYESIPLVAPLDGMTSADYIIVMSQDRLSAIQFDFMAGWINTTAARIGAVSYWNGSVYVGLTEVDGTSLSTATMGQSGLLWWVPPSEAIEAQKTEFGKTGYSYHIAFNNTLSGTYNTDVMTDAGDIAVDVVTVIPAQKTVPPFKFPSTYKNRVLLCNYDEGNEPNRCDYSQTNSTEIWNGADSSDGGTYSLYFGGSEALTAGHEIYNRYGSAVITLWTAFKAGETYVLKGDTVEDYKISKVSSNIGNPAPLTLASVEVAYEVAEDLRRNLLIWLSDVGPYSFDGQVLSPITGIEKYFDPDDPDVINFDSIAKSRGWYDAAKREYNLLIPTASATINNEWLVYDLLKKKWFRKDTGSAAFPQVGFTVEDAYGTKYPYGAIDTGYMMRLEYGASWDGTPIEQVAETGDFWPSGNIWDLTRIVRLKMAAKRIPEEHALTVQHYADTDDSQGLSGIWQSWSGGRWTDWEGGKWVSASLPSINLYLSDSINRIARDSIRDNLFGWSHRFRFSVSTFETTKGLQPIAWGIVYRKENRYDE